MKPYEMTARHNVRMAWKCLGKAREARSAAMMGIGDPAWFTTVMLDYSKGMVRVGRSYMRNAVLYRQMNEVL
jgi:hypothetical protein